MLKNIYPRTTLFSSRLCVLLITCLALNANSYGQEDLSAYWNGVWNAEGTLFTIGVSVEDSVMEVEQIESLGFLWTSKNGSIEGNVVRVEVEYAGVTGIIQAELIDPNTAIAFAATCLPEFMVVCALAKDRQAVFRRVESQ
ncbi:MAG: hypothetical protein HOF74_10545 [Gammaproteobacteria bacterium]|nr:hypothetical protein [Gammaproteobacteria bacterium]MBT3860260.1 hypothetical protein [Gammaproteobacteria bacterium]MBT3987552.1 hypothetical protein [Gammaproteobacteria bacterium]MBT4581710.1 hypothetical protein [Gammaproteobacteria bacterium]MBT4659570.1 hypothetical protein [Gammaproteobacteria bacterium]